MKQAINYYYKNYKNVTGIDDYSYIEKGQDNIYILEQITTGLL